MKIPAASYLGAGSIFWGQGPSKTYIMNHIQAVSKLLSRGNPEWKLLRDFYSVGPTIVVAGQFKQDLQTGLGKPKHNKRNQEVDIEISLGLASFQEVKEDDFRGVFSGLLIDSCERVVTFISTHKGLSESPIDPVEIDERWRRAVCDYLDSPLPIHHKLDRTKQACPNGSEYYFRFTTSQSRSSFVESLKNSGLEITLSTEQSQYWCALISSKPFLSSVELELVSLCSLHGGEYDGFSTSLS